MKPVSGLSVAICAFALVTLRPASALGDVARSSGIEEHIGASLPLDAPFIDSESRPLRLGDALGRGKPVILVLAYHRCQMLCNLVLRGVADAVRGLKGKGAPEFGLVTISIDPSETPDEAARTQSLVLERAGYAGQRARWRFLVGKRAAIDRVANAVGFKYSWDPKTEQFAHPAAVFVIGGEASVQAYLYGPRLDPAELSRALAASRVIPEPSHWAAALACFRFDSTKTRYGALINHAFQFGAGLVFFALALTILRLAGRRSKP